MKIIKKAITLEFTRKEIDTVLEAYKCLNQIIKDLQDAYKTFGEEDFVNSNIEIHGLIEEMQLAKSGLDKCLFDMDPYYDEEE